MRIAEIMTRNVRSVPPELSAQRAWSEMQRARIHHLVVMERARIVGIVSARDLGGPRGAAIRGHRTVADLMTPQVVAAAPETTVRKAAQLLRGRVIGCLPVVDGKQLVGIVTITDLLDLLGRGADRPAAESPPRSSKGGGARKAAPPRVKPRPIQGSSRT
ncbi:MAG: CBS domain-containing protein [Myxococcota bacterium]|nr:CBS domain-containing protein [Myxococcota bacterium]